MNWLPIESGKSSWLYSGNDKQDLERRCIGHLRGDFGRSGKEFWTSWFDHELILKTEEFREEFNEVVNELRDGLLSDFYTMYKESRTGLLLERDEYGLCSESDHFIYCLRCIPRKGDYNFYIYCYDKGVN